MLDLITLALAHFGCCAAHSGPIFHMVSYAMICGIAPLTAVTVYSLAGFSGLGGRLLLGVLADRLGAKPVLVGGLFVQALSVATYLAVAQLGEFYALSVIFGLAYGGVMPLYAVLVREYFGARIMGSVFGAVSAFASLGMALGPFGRRMGVRNTFNTYNWLYVGSFAIGLPRSRWRCAFRPKSGHQSLRSTSGRARREYVRDGPHRLDRRRRMGHHHGCAKKTRDYEDAHEQTSRR